MPIIEVDRAASVVVVKRSMSPGFAGIDNPLFYGPKTSMLFADAKQALEDVAAAVKAL
jgi:NAD(P) transhydrogenase subunit beta